MKFVLIFFCFFSVILSANIKAQPTDDGKQTVISAENTVSIAKNNLMQKLAELSAFKADFNQQVLSEEGQLLQTNKGRLAVSKPNLLYWSIIEPDESLIVSDGNTLWFYDPFIEQVTLYNIDNAINNTPILLLVNSDPTLWQNYLIKQISSEHFIIQSKDENSQVKLLTLVFNKAGNSLIKFEILDATGQLSRISLSNNQTLNADDKKLFQYTPIEGVAIDDQR